MVFQKYFRQFQRIPKVFVSVDGGCNLKEALPTDEKKMIYA